MLQEGLYACMEVFGEASVRILTASGLRWLYSGQSGVPGHSDVWVSRGFCGLVAAALVQHRSGSTVAGVGPGGLRGLSGNLWCRGACVGHGGEALESRVRHTRPGTCNLSLAVAVWSLLSACLTCEVSAGGQQGVGSRQGTVICAADVSWGWMAVD